MSRICLVLTAATLLGSYPAYAQANTECQNFLAMNDVGRNAKLAELNIYAAGVRDGADIGCSSKAAALTQSEKITCYILSRSKDYYGLDERQKLAMVEEGCRTDQTKQLRIFVLAYIAGGR